VVTVWLDEHLLRGDERRLIMGKWGKSEGDRLLFLDILFVFFNFFCTPNHFVFEIRKIINNKNKQFSFDVIVLPVLVIFVVLVFLLDL
jgi:hypothetical protein